MGMFDLACVHDATIYALNHLDIPRERLENIHTFTYPAGAHDVHVPDCTQKAQK